MTKTSKKPPPTRKHKLMQPTMLLKIFCPEPTCLKVFKTERSLTAHIAKSPTCAQALTKYINNQKLLQAKAMLQNSEIKQLTTSEGAFQTTNETESVSSEDTNNNMILSDGEDTNEADPNMAGTNEITNEQPQPQQYQSTDKPSLCFTDNMYFQVKLMQILDNANAQHYLYQQIIEWVIETQEAKVSFYDVSKSREANITQIERWMPSLQLTAPYTVTTLLETNGQPDKIEVTVFDFRTQLVSLLQDKTLFGNLENLDVNPDNVFGKYQSPNKVLSTVNSGKRYKVAYKTMINSPDKEFLVPIIFATDETKISNQGKASSWPLVFTTSILNQSMRNKASAWRILGYITDLSYTTSSNQEKQFTTHLKYTRLHQVLKSILQSFVAFQKDNVNNEIYVTLGDTSKSVRIKTPCFYIIGDMQGGDKMACSSPCYSNKMNRLCRKCNIKGSESGNPYAECQKIKMLPIQHMVLQNRKEELDALNQYHVLNAWFDVDFGGCPYGIFSASCPVEPLHALENGLIADCLKVLLARIGSSKHKARLDEITKQLIKYPRQQLMSFGADKEMPRLLWQEGISCLNETTAATKVGIMLTIVVISLQSEGKEFFIEVLGDVKIVNDMRECFQMILCYWIWLKKDTYWCRNDRESLLAAKMAIRKMLSKIVSLWPRTEGQGWHLAKFHEQLHVPDDILYNGAPSGSHSGPLEHNHIRMVKKPSQRTQKRRKVLDMQLAQRNYESYIIQRALQYMQPVVDQHKAYLKTEGENKQTDGPTQMASKGRLKIKIQNNNRVAFYTNQNLRLSNETLDYIVNGYCVDLELNKCSIDYWSEHIKDGTLYRAHTDYRKQGPWYDWVMIKWEPDGKTIQTKQKRTECNIDYQDRKADKKQFLYCPGQILAFVSPPEGGYHAIVKCCDYNFNRSSVFSTLWKQAYVYPTRNSKKKYIYHVEVQAIVRPALMIPMNENEDEYQEIWQRQLWGKEFN